MRGTIRPLPQNVFMAWCLVKGRDILKTQFTVIPPSMPMSSKWSLSFRVPCCLHLQIVTPYNVVVGYQRFRGACCLHLQVWSACGQQISLANRILSIASFQIHPQSQVMFICPSDFTLYIPTPELASLSKLRTKIWYSLLSVRS
jgi:hypothetical protein